MNLNGDTPTLNYPRTSFGSGTIKDCMDNYLFIIEKTIKKDTSIFDNMTFGMFSKPKPEKIYYATCITSQEMKKIIDNQYNEYKEKLKEVPYIPYKLKLSYYMGMKIIEQNKKILCFLKHLAKG